MTIASAASADLLATIVAATRRIVEVRQSREPTSALARRADRREIRPGVFRAALSTVRLKPDTTETTVLSETSVVSGFGRTRINVIAECKRRSPSRGVLRERYDPVAIASGYAEAGAAAISVLTEPTFFDGSLEHLEAVRGAVDRPLLRKDFIVSEYQLLEARAAGADAVLLIVAALAPSQLRGLRERAASLELDVLVEVHNRDELSIAIDAGAAIIGVNNRNLRTLAVDVRASDDLIEWMPAGVIAVSESGLKSHEDLTRLSARGYHAFLIGERFMSAPDPGSALRAMLEVDGARG
jgi:indole-3-glycerol phosphate synthase